MLHSSDCKSPRRDKHHSRCRSPAFRRTRPPCRHRSSCRGFRHCSSWRRVPTRLSKCPSSGHSSPGPGIGRSPCKRRDCSRCTHLRRTRTSDCRGSSPCKRSHQRPLGWSIAPCSGCTFRRGGKHQVPCTSPDSSQRRYRFGKNRSVCTRFRRYTRCRWRRQDSSTLRCWDCTRQRCGIDRLRCRLRGLPLCRRLPGRSRSSRRRFRRCRPSRWAPSASSRLPCSDCRRLRRGIDRLPRIER
jgi:hypothetical protein